MKITTVDLETITPDYAPPDDDPDRFAPLVYHQVVVAGWQVAELMSRGGRVTCAFRLRSVPCMDEEAEREALDALGEDLAVSDRIVTWNGRGFDMPLLGLRALKYGLDWSFWIDKRHRFGRWKTPLVHYDLMDQLSDEGGARGGSKLDDVAKLIGLPGKGDVSGADVGRMWPSQAERVAQYCAEDVAQTWLAYLKWTETFKGAGMAAEVRRAWIEWAITQPLLAGLMAAVKR